MVNELQHLLEKYAEHSLTPVEAERLLELLDNPKNLVQAQADLAVHGLLAASAFGEVSGDDLLEEVERVVDLEGEPNQFESDLLGVIRKRIRRKRWLIAAAAVACVTLTTWSLLRQGLPAVADEDPAPVVLLPDDPDNPAAAVMTAQRNGVWRLHERIETGAPLRIGAYELVKGTVALTTRGGNLVVIRGPANLELLEESLNLIDGEVGVRVPAGGSYQVRTPGLRIVDLGTEFGVSVNSEAETRLFVFEGAVSVAYEDRSQERPMRVVQGTGLSYSPKLGTSLIGSAGGLIQATEECQRLGIGNYELLVNSQGAVRYWRFDPSESDGRLLSNGDVTRETVGSNAVLRFMSRHPQAVADGFRSDGGLVPGNLVQPPITVSLWFSTADLTWSGDFSNNDRRILLGFVLPEVDSEGLQPVNFSVELMNKRCPKRHFRVRTVYRNPPSVKHGLQLLTAEPLPIKTWHHLVVRIAPTEVSMWLNGEPAVSSRLGTENVALPDQLRVVFGQRSAFGNDQRYYAGYVDEVAIFDELLTYSQIRDQYKLGRQLFQAARAATEQ